MGFKGVFIARTCFPDENYYFDQVLKRQTFYLGNFAPYLVSYMRNRTDEADLRNVDGLWITMFGGLGNSFGMTIGGLLDKRFGPRVATAVGSVLFRCVLKLFLNCKLNVITLPSLTPVVRKIGRAYQKHVKDLGYF